MSTSVNRIHFPFLLVMILPLILCTSCGKKDDDNAKAKDHRWKISMIKYEDLRQTADAEKGFLAGLKEEGLVETQDYVIINRSAQGELASVLSMLDQTNTDGTDMIVTLQTTTLHSAIERGAPVPLVFMVIANPFVISRVGSNDSTHLPNVAGVYTDTKFEQMIAYVKQCLPSVHKVGTLFSTGELNATYYKNQLQTAVNAAGLKLQTFGVGEKTDVPQATQALCNRDIQAIVQIEDNLTSSTFPAIMRVAREYRIPVFSFVNDQAEKGSVLVFAPDYTAGARRAAKVAARIIRGEKPMDIAFERIAKFDFIVNTVAAKEFGITIPESIIKKADMILDENHRTID